MESKGLRVALRIWVGLVLAFLFLPIVLIVLYSFNSSNIESWPIAGFTLHWFSVAFHDPQVRIAFLLSVKVGLISTVLALLLGSAVADRSVAGPGGTHLADHPVGNAAARSAGNRRRIDLHVLTDSRRLHHPAAGRRDQRDVHG